MGVAWFDGKGRNGTWQYDLKRRERDGDESLVAPSCPVEGAELACRSPFRTGMDPMSLHIGKPQNIGVKDEASGRLPQSKEVAALKCGWYGRVDECWLGQ